MRRGLVLPTVRMPVAFHRAISDANVGILPIDTGVARLAFRAATMHVCWGLLALVHVT